MKLLSKSVKTTAPLRTYIITFSTVPLLSLLKWISDFHKKETLIFPKSAEWKIMGNWLATK